MRLGYLCHAELFSTGGPGARTADLLAAFARLGHEVHVRAGALPAGLRAVRHGLDDDGLAAMARAVDICLVRLDGSCHAERLADQMLAVRPDLPVVLEVHAPLEEQRCYPMANDQERRTREEWIARGNAIRRGLVARGAAAVCGSREMEQYAREALGATHTLVSPNAADPERFRPNAAAQGPFTALWTGSPQYVWQAVGLVLAAAKLAPEIRFLLVCSSREGVPPEQPPNVEAVFGAGRAEMAALYARSHVALVLYHAPPETPWGFYFSPLKLYEALAAGVAVIGSDRGQIAEVLREAGCGTLVRDDPAQVAGALRALAGDPARAVAMGRAARSRAESRTWTHAASEVVQFCAAILTTRPPAASP